MTSIGSTPGVGAGSSIDTNPLRQAATASQSATGLGGDAASTAANALTNTLNPTSASSAQIVTSSALSAGQIPIDNSRVDSIKKAIATGNYPLVPAKIGDAMIAAGIMLRSPK